jgi:anaerobic sulfite reductase subunit C
MDWTEEANDAISRVPFFIRKRIKRKVEEEIARAGDRLVTMDHVRSSQKRFLTRMEDEVKGYQVETCFGPGGCPNRAIEYDDLVSELEDQLAKQDLKTFLKAKVSSPLKMHHEFRISISDCPNACSRPQITDIGIIGACAPVITEKDCNECEVCVDICKEDAIFLKMGRPIIHEDKCVYCGQCIRVCPTGTLTEGKKGFRLQVGGKLGRHPRLATELPGIYDASDYP